MRLFIGWIGRTAVLFLLLAVTIGFATLAGPHLVTAWADGTVQRDFQNAATTAETIAAEQRAAAEALINQAARLDTMADSQLKARHSALLRRKSELEAERAAPPGWFDGLRPSRIIAKQRLAIEELVVNQELAIVVLIMDRSARRAKLAQFHPLPTIEVHRRAIARCNASRAAISKFNRQSSIQRTIDDIFDDAIAQLVQKQKKACDDAADISTKRKDATAALATYHTAHAAVTAAREAGIAAIAKQNLAPDARAATLRDILRLAALALAAILLAPLLIRALLYVVIAPLAARRPGVRIAAPGATGPTIPTAPPPAVSLALTLAEGEELLVRLGYFQSWSDDAVQATRWLLSLRHPGVSIASGLVFLTQVRGQGARVTVSATASAVAEVSAVTLPSGAACVIRPRAIVAVIQPVATPMRVTSHWRFFSIQAWLTLQFRYLVFHGPARILLAGGRGVQVEPADSGRAFGSDQLVGFTPGLAYAITRTGTFWPYIFGQSDLFVDRVAAGDGVVLIEEAPVAAAHGRRKRGLEGAADAVLKLFGV